MLSEFLSSMLPCSKTQSQSNSLIQENAKVPAALAGNYEPHIAQELQKVVAIVSSTMQEVLMVSKQKLAEITLLEEKGQRQPPKGEARAPQQQSTSSKTSLIANLVSTLSKNEIRVQQETSSKDSPKIYVGERITHSETLDYTLLYQDDAQCTLASSKNGAEDSADQHRRSKTYVTESDLEKIRNRDDSASFNLMNYSVTSYSLDEEVDQKTPFSSNSYELEDGRTRYKYDPSNNGLSSEKITSYSPRSYSGNEISENNVLGWLTTVFADARDATLRMMRSLGMQIQSNTNNLNELIKANEIIKAAFDDLKDDKWEWGEKKESDGKITIVPKEKYREAFELMRKHKVTVGGLDPEEFLRQRSKELSPDKPQTNIFQSHFEKIHNYHTRSTESLALAAEREAAGCNHSFAEMEKLAVPAEKEPTEWVLKGALNEISNRMDNVIRERNDANAKLHSDVTYQENLYQSFQTAQINTALIIAKLMEMAFTKIPIV